MSELIFSAEELRPVIQYTVDSKRHTPTFAQMYEEKHWKKGAKMPASGFPTGDMIDHARVEGSCHFVKDDGIYIMSSAAERDIIKDPDGKERSRVVYAIGYDPRKNEDVWEASRAAVGGDDFVEALPLSWFTPILEDPSITAVILRVSSNNIQFALSRAPLK